MVKIKGIGRITEDGMVVPVDIITKVGTIKAIDTAAAAVGVAIGVGEVVGVGVEVEVGVTGGLIEAWRFHVHLLYFFSCGVLWKRCGLQSCQEWTAGLQMGYMLVRVKLLSGFSNFGD